MEERSLSTLLKSIGVGILLSFTIGLINFLPWQKVLKSYPRNFTFKNSKRHEYFIFKVATGRWHLPTIATMIGPSLSVTQSSNNHGDVVGLLLLGIQIVACHNRDTHHYLIGPTCQSCNVAMSMKSSAHCYCEFDVSCPMTEASLRIATGRGYLNLSDGFLFINN
jgi:hypothetical protein